MTRRILIVANPHRPETLEAGEEVARVLAQAGIECCTDFTPGVSPPIEAAIVLGGDGTMLHAARKTHGTDIPLLGVNLGRVGFLAELERDDVATAAQRLADGDYTVEERGTLRVTVTSADGTAEEGWALNEATLERANRLRTLEVTLAVDGEPLSSFGCDGVVVSTATGSTAHAFSAGGPVMWPDVDALLCVPLAAHALFARPLVVGPSSSFAIQVVPSSESSGQVVLDGASSIEAGRGSVVDIRRGEHSVRLARMSDDPFTARLVRKFSLPTDGWRGERAYPTPIGHEIHSQQRANDPDAAPVADPVRAGGPDEDG
ncbi:NAD kinase [Demequina aestuarii]|uniref:NAD kinase n=1 Tax=Demequina aestuarii TaxID=327095 RepID=UPI000785351D|nr:NAD kinase [Demequina aestuarii]